MFKFKYKVHIKKDLSFIVLTFIFGTVPSWSETFGFNVLSFGCNALQNLNWPCAFHTLFQGLHIDTHIHTHTIVQINWNTSFK